MEVEYGLRMQVIVAYMFDTVGKGEWQKKGAADQGFQRGRLAF